MRVNYLFHLQEFVSTKNYHIIWYILETNHRSIWVGKCSADEFSGFNFNHKNHKNFATLT